MRKQCTKCLEFKDFSAFYRDYSIANSEGYRSKCKMCTKVEQQNRIANEKCDIVEKTCNTCKTTKTTEEFYKSTRHKDGYMSFCKECHKVKQANMGNNQKIKRTPEYMKEYWQKRYQDVNYRMKQNVKRYISLCIKRLSNSSVQKDQRTTKYLGCSIEFFVKWIEWRFESKMTWDNYAVYWELDHVQPVASFDCSNKNELEACFHWTNYQPLVKDENLTKSNTICKNYIKNKNAKSKNF